MEQAVSRRGIDYIWHFTRLENVEPILRDGIIPRAQLENRVPPPTFNDQHRHDRQRGASCFSIGHPNYKMFYQLRKEEPETRWVVIACRAAILWQKDCAFCHENAASNNVTCIPLQDRRGVAAFERLFLPIDGKPSRESLGLPDTCPTHPQAEVLVFDVVESRYIAGVICQDDATVQFLTSRNIGSEIGRIDSLFWPRKDYAHWR